MRRLVRFAPTRVLLFALADRGLLRRPIEEGAKRALVDIRGVDSIVAHLPVGETAGRPDDAEADVRRVG